MDNWESNEIEALNEAAQFNWVLQWLAKKECFKTADLLMEEYSPALLQAVEKVLVTANPISKLQSSWDTVHKQGILAVEVYPHAPYLLTSDTAKNLIVTSLKDGEVLSSVRENNPFLGSIIAIDCHPTKNYILIGTMDDRHAILKLHDDDGDVSISTVEKFEKHQKYVVRVRWSPDGSLFATGSHDRSVCIYEFVEKPDGTTQTHLKRQINFQGAVEAISFTKDSTELIVSVRDNYCLHYVNLATYNQRLINMNALGDKHVSFIALDICLSSDGELLAVSTDTSRTIIFKTGTPIQLRTLFGMKNDGLSQPRAAFDRQNILYVTSQDQRIYAFDTETDKMIASLEGHKGVVRDVTYNPVTDTLVSISYDKTIKVWERTEEAK